MTLAQALACLLLSFGSSFSSSRSKITSYTRNFHQSNPSLEMSYGATLSKSPVSYDTSILTSDTLPRAKYLTQAPSSRSEFGRKMTFDNKKYSSLGVDFRKQYMKLRMLSPEEEVAAGSLSMLGKELERTKQNLTEVLGREPSPKEWAEACDMSPVELIGFLDASVKARQSLVEHNLRLVDYWTRKIIEFTKAAKLVSYYELFMCGVVGLTKAAEKYDGRARFKVYADINIRAELFKGLTKLRPGSFVSPRKIALNIRAINAQRKLSHQLQRKPTDAEIASKLEVSVATLQAVRREAAQTVTSAQTTFSSSSDVGSDAAVTYLDLFLSANQDISSHTQESFLWRADFSDTLRSLPPFDRRTLALRYGLNDGRQRSIEMVAELMCVSVEAVRLSILKSMDRLRNSSCVDSLEQGPPQNPLTTVAGKKGAYLY